MPGPASTFPDYPQPNGRVDTVSGTVVPWGLAARGFVSGVAAVFASTGGPIMTANAYFDGVTWRHMNNQPVSVFQVSSLGSFTWFGATTTPQRGAAATLESRMTLDASGILGLGVTPSAWASESRIVQAGPRSSFGFSGGWTLIGNNTRLDTGGAVWKAIETGAGTLHVTNGDSLYWYTMASVSAGSTQTLVNRMALNPNGLGVGGTVRSSTYALDVLRNSNTTYFIGLNNATDSTASVLAFEMSIGAREVQLYMRGASHSSPEWGLYTDLPASTFKLWNNNTAHVFLDSSGKVGIGGAPSVDPLHLIRNANTSHAVYLDNATDGSATLSAFTMRIGATKTASFYMRGASHSSPEWGIYSDLVSSPFKIYNNNAVRMVVESDGRLYGTALHNNAGAVTGTTNQYIASGTYTPTLTGYDGGSGSNNVAATTSAVCQWLRVGNVVTVSGTIEVDPTSGGGTPTWVRITLPIGSGFSSATQCSGVGVVYTFGGSGSTAGRIFAHVAYSTTTAALHYQAMGTGNEAIAIHFTYVIL